MAVNGTVVVGDGRWHVDHSFDELRPFEPGRGVEPSLEFGAGQTIAVLEWRDPRRTRSRSPYWSDWACGHGNTSVAIITCGLQRGRRTAGSAGAGRSGAP